MKVVSIEKSSLRSVVIPLLGSNESESSVGFAPGVSSINVIESSKSSIEKIESLLFVIENTSNVLSLFVLFWLFAFEESSSFIISSENREMLKSSSSSSISGVEVVTISSSSRFTLIS